MKYLLILFISCFLYGNQSMALDLDLAEESVDSVKLVSAVKNSEERFKNKNAYNLVLEVTFDLPSSGYDYVGKMIETDVEEASRTVRVFIAKNGYGGSQMPIRTRKQINLFMNMDYTSIINFNSESDRRSYLFQPSLNKLILINE